MSAFKIVMDKDSGLKLSDITGVFTEIATRLSEKVYKEHPNATEDQRNELLQNEINREAANRKLPFTIDTVVDDANIPPFVMELAQHLFSSSLNRADWNRETGQAFLKIIDAASEKAISHLDPIQTYSDIGSAFIHAFCRDLMGFEFVDANDRQKKLVHRIRQLAARVAMATLYNHLTHNANAHGPNCSVGQLGLDREELIGDLHAIARGKMEERVTIISDELKDVYSLMSETATLN